MLAIVVAAAAGTLNMPCIELKNIELERATITSAVDVAGKSFGWINRDFIIAGKTGTQFCLRIVERLQNRSQSFDHPPAVGGQ